MKRVFISLVVVLCIFMSACVSNKKYKALEERVVALEKIHGIKVKEDSDSKSKNKSGKSTYPLNKKTEQEIFGEIMAVLQNEPYQGQTVDEYVKVFEGKPVNKDYFVKGYDLIRFYFRENLQDEPQNDQIASAEVTGIYQNMDGSIGIYSNTKNFYSCAVFYLMDYDRAAKVYDLLLEELSKQYKSVNNDLYEHTKWTATGSPEEGESRTFLTMEKQEGYYKLVVLCQLNK